MWRVKGLVLRVLHRCHSSTPLRLPQNHHVEDEVITTSSVLSTSRNSSDSSSHKDEDDGQSRKKQKAFYFASSERTRYTGLDAVGWICRRIHSSFSSLFEPGPTAGVRTPQPSALQKCASRLLLDILLSNDTVLRGRSVLCLHNQSLSSGGGGGGGSDVASNSGERNFVTTNASVSDCEGALGQDSSFRATDDSSLTSSSWSEGKVDAETDHARDTVHNCPSVGKEKLAEPTQNLEKVSHSSVPVILNMIGLRRAEIGDNEEAFSCFLAAAQRGYGKALFNVGVCYEKGRGVAEDRAKASHYYWRAAMAGHQQAQYRCAKLLLTSRGHQSEEDLKTAISLLEKAAAAGLTKAQLCLASVYSREPSRDSSKSLRYLQVAAQNNDPTALLLLAQCYESGFGVRQNLTTALGLYTRAARAGDERPRLSLTPPGRTGVLRSIRSSPCFSAADRNPPRPPPASLPDLVGADVDLPFLPRSWSTGSVAATSGITSAPRDLRPLSLEGRSCQWIVGVG
ncbi:death ligand signal enhancer isoform X2 [Syngnathoides biaculeatus]|uniref:death ligand signal enhancer isoform X2 n=1 Tax=Syngnathoides biaculeatus TaxID=300417 RepID=UPI002ADE296E|nr:death ligand signal enhancer isoform X2 [Syngnathoides biaculeatus]